MIDLKIGPFITAFNGVSSWMQTSLLAPAGSTMRMPNRDFAQLTENVETLLAISQECGFGVVAVCAEEALSELARFHANPGDYKFLITPEEMIPLQGRIGRLKDAVIGETKTRSALILNANAKELWQPSKPTFGDDFKNKFQSAQYDLDEACKCLALGRSTAAVFHLMRITETGLQALHGCLGIPVALAGNDRNWGKILGRVRDDIKQRGTRWAEHDQFQEFYALLDAVKDAWRNATMHIENKYTPDEAQHIFNMVRGFMGRIALRMDENGEPKA